MIQVSKLLIIVFIIAFYMVRRFVAHEIKDRPKVGWGEMALICLFGLGQIILPLIWVYSDILSFADYTSWHGGFIFLGIIFEIIGLYLLFRSHVDLGQNWAVAPAIKEKHQLIVGGIYEKIRHPMYLSFFLTAIAQIFVVANWLVGPSYFLAVLLMYVFRIDKEEKMLIERFGEQYLDYMKTTNRLFPKLIDI